MPQQRSAVRRPRKPTSCSAAKPSRSIGPSTYQITNGGFTTCVQPTPRWEMSGTQRVDHARRTRGDEERRAERQGRAARLTCRSSTTRSTRKTARPVSCCRPGGSTTYQGFTAQQRVLLGDRSQPGRDVLPRLLFENRAGLRRRIPLRRGAGIDGTGRPMSFHEKDQYADDGVTLTQAAHKAYKLFGNTNHALPHGFRFLATSTTSATSPRNKSTSRT